MARLRNRQDYDRSRILEMATRAIARKQHRKAIACYRRILAVEPQNPELHRKIAPLLAHTHQEFDAWLSYQIAGRALLREGHVERALGLYRDAAHALPRNVEVWRTIARLQNQRERNDEALETLFEGSRRLRGRAHRPQAIYLLRRAHEIAPENVQAGLELARLLCKTRQTEEARLLMERLAERCCETELRRVRAAQLRLFPSLATGWRWLRVAVGRRGGSARRDHPPGDIVTLRHARRRR